MNTAEVISAAAGILLGYPLWTVVHEASHVVAAKRVGRLAAVRWKLYPHRTPRGTFNFAAVEWDWKKRPGTKRDWASIYYAPRLPDAIAVLMLPLCAALPGPAAAAWAAIWGCGLVDLFVGSLGISDESDLKRASRLLGWSPWRMRIAGFAAIGASIAAAVLSLFG